MAKSISHIQLDDNIGLTECLDGFWLYDKTQGMNLSMKAATANDAFLEALQYYQKRLSTTEKALTGLQNKVNGFVSQFVVEKEEYIDGYITTLEINI